jgi:hypothetical protein
MPRDRTVSPAAILHLLPQARHAWGCPSVKGQDGPGNARGLADGPCLVVWHGRRSQGGRGYERRGGAAGGVGPGQGWPVRRGGTQALNTALNAGKAQIGTHK